MTLGRQITAVVLGFAWCFATAHLWVAHPGERFLQTTSEAHAHHGHEHHDDDDHREGGDHEGEGQPAEDSHHHHGIEAAARAAASLESPIAAPLVALIADALILVSGPATDEPLPEITGSPPDERRSRYLYVIQTARPVRGPSLVA